MQHYEVGYTMVCYGICTDDTGNGTIQLPVYVKNFWLGSFRVLDEGLFVF